MEAILHGVPLEMASSLATKSSGEGEALEASRIRLRSSEDGGGAEPKVGSGEFENISLCPSEIDAFTMRLAGIVPR